LMREHRHVAEFGICDAEYVKQALNFVEMAHNAVLAEAKAELVTSQDNPK
jgi:hypothetical protein